MHNNNLISALFSALLSTSGCSLLVIGNAAAESYSYTTIDIPPGLGYDTEPQGINDAGQIVGEYYNGGNRSFMFSSGRFSSADVPNALQTIVGSINNTGYVAGYFSDTTNAHGYIGQGATLTATIDVPGAVNGTFARGINDYGQVTGHFEDHSQNTITAGYLGFLYDAGMITTINVPGSQGTNGTSMTLPQEINNVGQIVGWYADNGGVTGHGFLYNAGSYSTLDNPAGHGTAAYGINDAGQIVGLFKDNTTNQEHGFVYSADVYTTLDVPGSSSTFAMGINNNDQVVGWYRDSGGQIHGFLATPISVVPLPDAFWLFGSGLVGLFGFMWRPSITRS